MTPRVMRRFSVAMTLLLLGLSIASKASALEGMKEYPDHPPLPPSEIVDQNGAPFSFSRLAGRILVINLWATWCVPCVKEMPALDRLAASLPRDRFEFAALSQDKGGIAVARPFLEKLNVRNLNLYADPSGRFYRNVGAKGLPTTLIVDPAGRLIGRIEGAIDWDTPNVAKYFSNLVAQ